MLKHAFIKKKKFIDPVDAFIYVVEFYKRGSPHAHVLIMRPHKIISAEHFDEYVYAEIIIQKITVICIPLYLRI